ncbi:FkbM family methyltransferase [Burkholderia cenocepacia]|uniref:Glycosyl transferase n=3 Tax=Burkholderia cenocepacia TaxID=95486 RepID=A0AAD0J4H7_9BURK|nr:FkbM family methyltransferase [Burkholderia cenocepacia]AWG31094.1 Glycosyl transferase [Burkholderia cenocepacia]EAY62631.1 Glycosyl transferase [Burkholderia cenocepacia PC184]
MTLISFAQNQEDVMLWRALGHVRNGFYIDVGAADPVDLSVTKLFYDHGWHGINLEPQSAYFTMLTAARPHDINLQLAAGRQAASHVFHRVDGTGLSTFDPEIAARHRANGWTVVEENVEALPLAEICERYRPNGPIHFLKIDVEGAEGDVLAGADFRRFRPWIVLVEATLPLSQEQSHAWEPTLTSQGYSFVWFDGLNRFYVADEMRDELAKHFLTPPNVFDEFQAPVHLLRRAEQAEQELQRVRDQAANEIRQAREQAAETLREANALNRNAILAVEQSARDADAASRRAEEAVQQMTQTLDEITRQSDAALAEQARRNDEVRRAAQQSDERVTAMLNSTSWRMTAPLRATVVRIPDSVRSTLRRGAKALWWAATPHRMPARIAFLRARRQQALVEASPPAAQAPGVPDAPLGRPVTDAVIEYRKATRHGREVALFVTHSPDGKLKPHVRPYISALRRQGIDVTLIVAADSAWFDSDALPLDEVDTLVVRENLGLDFAAWAHVMQLEPELFDAEALYLLNDSLIGPFNDASFEKMLARLRSEPADMVGLTESWEHQWHVQSFFLALRRRALASPILQDFFSNVVILPTKDDVIQRYEITLAPTLRDGGISHAVLFPSANHNNRTLFDWKNLIDDGFPFVKVMALRDKIDGVDTSDWRNVLKVQGYDVTLAEPVLSATATIPDRVESNPAQLRVPKHSTLLRHLPDTTLQPAIQFIGPWNYANGLGVASRSYVSALRRTPYALNIAPVKRPFHIHRRMAVPLDINDFSGPADVAAIHLNPEAWPALLIDEQQQAIQRARLKLGLFVWETENIPDYWHPTFGSVDAIWAPGRYCQKVFAASTDAPVHVIPYVVTVPPSLPPEEKIRRTKVEIGLEANERVILYAFDGSSYLVRKNPFALVRAFARTHLARSGWKLVLKTKHLFDMPQQGEQLQQLCDAAEGVVLINRPLDLDTMRNLMAMADIYASPHCAEGFGLTVAEAMAMGKIVVATDYSGTCDFLDERCGFPVRYTVAALQDDHGAYTTGNVWAQVDEDHLAESLEKAAALVEKDDHAIGDAARARIATDLSAERVGALIQHSIEQLLAPRRRA